MLSPRTRRVIHEGMEALLVLSRLRHKQWVATSEWDGILLTEAYEEVKDAPAPSWLLPEAGRGLSAARVARSAAMVDSWLDPGLVLGWLSAERPGGRMMREIEGVYRQAFLEERGPDSSEPTAYLAQLALTRTMADAWLDGVSSIHSAAFAERMGLAGSVLIHALLEETVGAAFENPAVVDTKMIDVRAEYLLRTSVSPITFLPNASSAAAPYAYGLNAETVASVERHLAEVDLLDGDLEDIVRSLSHAVTNEVGFTDIIVVQASVEEVRHAALVLASKLNPRVAGIAAELGRMAADPDSARDALIGTQRRQQLIEALEQLTSSNPHLADEAVELAEALSPGMSSTAMNEETIQTRVREAVRACVVMECDRRARVAVRDAAKVLVDVVQARGADEAEAGYDHGQVYRFGGDDRPVLQASQNKTESQMFLDLSELIAATIRVSGNRYASLLRDHLFQPLLATTQKAASEGKVRSHDLSADTLAFAGDVTELVDLVPQIRAVYRAYRDRLENEVPAAQRAAELERIQSELRVARQDLARRRDRAKSLLYEIEQGLGEAKEDTTGTLRLGATAIAEIRRLQNELYRIEEEETQLDRIAEQATQTAVGSGVDSGIFISHGAASETLELDDPGWGTRSIPVSQALGEALRGTARNPAVSRRLDLVVRHAREMRGVSEISFPFRVYIDKIWSVPVPPALVPEFRYAIDERDMGEAERLFGELARQATADFKESAQHDGPLDFKLIEATHDIYNAGCALTEETLLAYREGAGRDVDFFQRDVRLSELNPAFHERFAFGRARLKLVFVVPFDGDRPRHIFRDVGSLVFRRFDGRKSVGVYEMLDPADPFYQLLLEHHFKWWWQERQQAHDQAVL